MDPAIVRAKLIEVLETVQALSGEQCPSIDGTTRPAESLPNFVSKVWPVAAGMLGEAIGKTIPCEANIFVDDATNQALCIDQIVALVVKIVGEQDKEEAAAA